MGCGASSVAQVVPYQPLQQTLARGSDEDEDTKIKEKNYSIVCLGAGEAGKSSFYRALQKLSVTNQAAAEEKQMTDLIRITLRSNLLDTLNSIVKFLVSPDQSDQILKNSCDMKWLESIKKEVLSGLRADNDWSASDQQTITKLSQYEPVVSACEYRDSFWVPENAMYYLQNSVRIASSLSFEVSDLDRRLARVKTLGINETTLYLKNGKKIRLVDVGGQRSERAKWLYMFAEVNEIFWFENIIGYSGVQFEDQKMNKLQESMALFQTIVNHSMLKKVTFHVVFTKLDLLPDTLTKFVPYPFPIPNPANISKLLRPISAAGSLSATSSTQDLNSISRPAIGIDSILDIPTFKNSLSKEDSLCVRNIPISSFRRRRSSTPITKEVPVVTEQIWREELVTAFTKRSPNKIKFHFASIHDANSIKELLAHLDATK